MYVFASTAKWLVRLTPCSYSVFLKFRLYILLPETSDLPQSWEFLPFLVSRYCGISLLPFVYLEAQP